MAEDSGNTTKESNTTTTTDKVVTYTFGPYDYLSVSGYLLPKNTPVQMPATDAKTVQEMVESRRVEVTVEDLTKENKPSADSYGGSY